MTILYSSVKLNEVNKFRVEVALFKSNPYDMTGIEDYGRKGEAPKAYVS